MVSIVIAAIIWGSPPKQEPPFEPPRHMVYVQITRDGINAKERVILHQVCLPIARHGTTVHGFTKGTASWKVEALILPKPQGKLLLKVNTQGSDGEGSIAADMMIQPGKRLRIMLPKALNSEQQQWLELLIPKGG